MTSVQDPPAPVIQEVRGALKRSGGDFVISAAASYVVMALSLLLTVLTTRILGAAGYGQVALVLTVGQTLALIGTFWTTGGLVRLGSEAWLASDTFRRVFWGRNAIILAPVLLLCIGVLLAPDAVLARTGLPAAARWPVAAYFTALVVYQTGQFTFQALKRVRQFVLWQVAEKAALIGLIWWWAAALRHDSLLLAMAYAATSALIGFAALAGLPRSTWLPIETDGATIRRFLKFSWPLLLSLTCGCLSTNWIDLLIIQRYGSLADVGHFNLSYQIMGMVQVLPTLSFPVTLPLLVTWQVAGHQQGVELYAGRLVPHAYMMLAVMLVITMAALQPVILACFGAEFAAAVLPCGWLLLAVGFYGIYISTLPLLTLWERTDLMLVAGAAGGVVHLLGDLALVPRLGIAGAAVSTALAQGVSALLVLAAVRRRTAVPLRTLLFGVAAVAASLWGCVIIGQVAGRVLGLVASAVLLIGAIGAGRLFGHEERQWLRRQYFARREAASAA